MNQPPIYLAVNFAGAACLALLMSGTVHADIYRCIDSGGDVTYSDSACPGEAMSSNITESVACTTAECQAQAERARASAEVAVIVPSPLAGEGSRSGWTTMKWVRSSCGYPSLI